MNKEIIGSATGTALSLIGTTTQTQEVLQYISLGITIIGGILTIIMSILAWYKNAKKDGKITQDEIEDIIQKTQDHLDDINDNINKK